MILAIYIMALRFLFVLGTTSILVKAQNLSHANATYSQQDNGQNNVVLDGNIQSFDAVLKEMEASLKAADNTDSCYSYDPQNPNFNVKGRRISEIKCLNYIWDIKKEEEDRRITEKCADLSGIIGGRPSLPGEFPHMAAIGWKDVKKGKWAFKCGGSLISDRFVLTAAHCLEDNERNSPKIVRLGVVNIANETLIAEGIGRDVKIRNNITHPKYKKDKKNFDIALIELDEEIQFTDYIQPACILNQKGINQSIITGWGLTDEKKEFLTSDELLKAEVNIFPTRYCKEKWWPRRSKTDWQHFFLDQMCAIKKGGKADFCGGDSGGPLQNKLYINTNKSIHNLVGITSFNYKCGGPAGERYPSVYTSVQYHIKWIEKKVWGAETRQTSASEVQDQPNNIEQSASGTRVIRNNTKPLASEDQDQFNNVIHSTSEVQENPNIFKPSTSRAQVNPNNIKPSTSEVQEISDNIEPSAFEVQENHSNIKPSDVEEQDQANNIKPTTSRAQANLNNIKPSTFEVQDQPNNIIPMTVISSNTDNNLINVVPSITEITDQYINIVPLKKILEKNEKLIEYNIGSTNQGRDVVFGNLFWFNATNKDGWTYYTKNESATIKKFHN